jgi:hypothetical protein
MGPGTAGVSLTTAPGTPSTASRMSAHPFTRHFKIHSQLGGLAAAEMFRRTAIMLEIASRVTHELGSDRTFPLGSSAANSGCPPLPDDA